MKITSVTVVYERNYQVEPFNMIKVGGSIVADLEDGDMMDEVRSELMIVLKDEVRSEVKEAIVAAKAARERADQKAKEAIESGRSLINGGK